MPDMDPNSQPGAQSDPNNEVYNQPGRDYSTNGNGKDSIIYKGLKEAGATDGSTTPNSLDTEVKTYNFNDNSGRIKILAIVLIAIVALFALTYILPKLHTTQHGATTSKTTISTTTQVTTTAYTTEPFDVHIININEFFNYTGANQINGVSCKYASHSTYQTINGDINSSSQFPVYYTVQSESCPLNITNITILTPGFKIISSNPKIPIQMQPNSSVYIALQINSPPYNFSGPITFRINEN